METPKLDYKHLISLVRERRELYDNTMADYRNREHIINIWIKIANDLRTNVMDVKAKWQMLRCNYMREKKKVQKRISQGGSTLSPTTWSYFYLLTFLDDYKDESNKDTPHEHVMEQNTSSSYELTSIHTSVDIKREFLESDLSDNVGYDISDSITQENRATTSEPSFAYYTTSAPDTIRETDTECNVDVGSSTNNQLRCSRNDGPSNIAECHGLTKVVKVEVDIKPSQKRKLSSEEHNVVKVERQTASPEPSDCQNVTSNLSYDVSADSDQQFFNSLLPFVKTLSPMQNLEFRSGVINFLFRVSNK